MSSVVRRDLLRASAGTAVGLAAGANAGGSSGGQATLVLVHTGNASAAWWDGVVRALTLAGHRAVAVDLPGHGRHAYYPWAYQAQDLDRLKTERSPAADITVDDYAAAVAEVVRRARRHGPVVLVGHGDAGAAACTRVANASPDSVAHLVYVAAYLCVDRPTIGEYLELPENSDAVLAPVVETSPDLGIARINWRSADPDTLDAFRKALAGGFSRNELLATLGSLTPDIGVSLWGDDVRAVPKTWGRIPRTYIRFTAERTIPVPLQDRMIEEADARTPDNTFSVRSVDAPHVGPLGHPDVVRILRGLARTAG